MKWWYSQICVKRVTWFGSLSAKNTGINTHTHILLHCFNEFPLFLNLKRWLLIPIPRLSYTNTGHQAQTLWKIMENHSSCLKPHFCLQFWDFSDIHTWQKTSIWVCSENNYAWCEWLVLTGACAALLLPNSQIFGFVLLEFSTPGVKLLDCSYLR